MKKILTEFINKTLNRGCGGIDASEFFKAVDERLSSDETKIVEFINTIYNNSDDVNISNVGYVLANEGGVIITDVSVSLNGRTLRCKSYEDGNMITLHGHIEVIETFARSQFQSDILDCIQEIIIMVYITTLLQSDTIKDKIFRCIPQNVK